MLEEKILFCYAVGELDTIILSVTLSVTKHTSIICHAVGDLAHFLYSAIADGDMA